ncbi:MAG: arginyltransferase, partial [Gammaproteobacteria bacterium]
MTQAKSLHFFASPPESCSYLPQRDSISVFADPVAKMNARTYSQLVNHGFRRSGRYVYRPHCPSCSACVPARVPVRRFKPNRSQRRNLKANRDLSIRVLPCDFREEHFDLYRRYLSARHAGGQMDNPTPDTYRNFLQCDWLDTMFVEFRLAGELLSVAVADQLAGGLSAVYTFFDPDHSARGLGTYAVLWQIARARRRGLDYVYLGYWIAENAKMSYKIQFKPVEGLVDGKWRLLATP